MKGMKGMKGNLDRKGSEGINKKVEDVQKKIRVDTLIEERMKKEEA